MIIGIDFDNTIACYDGVFHRIAVDEGLIPADTGVSKTEVKDFLCSDGREAVWTELQGTVYGSNIAKARPYPGLIDCVSSLISNGHECVVVSHRTKFPYAGPQVDLHQAARQWISANGLDGVFPAAKVNMTLTKEEKLQAIDQLNCQVFVDDLSDILEAELFPVQTTGVLFDPQNQFDDRQGHHRVTSWADFGTWVAGL